MVNRATWYFHTTLKGVISHISTPKSICSFEGTAQLSLQGSCQNVQGKPALTGAKCYLRARIVKKNVCEYVAQALSKLQHSIDERWKLVLFTPTVYVLCIWFSVFIGEPRKVVVHESVETCCKRKHCNKKLIPDYKRLSKTNKDNLPLVKQSDSNPAMSTTLLFYLTLGKMTFDPVTMYAFLSKQPQSLRLHWGLH